MGGLQGMSTRCSESVMSLQTLDQEKVFKKKGKHHLKDEETKVKLQKKKKRAVIFCRKFHVVIRTPGSLSRMSCIRFPPQTPSKNSTVWESTVSIPIAHPVLSSICRSLPQRCRRKLRLYTEAHPERLGTGAGPWWEPEGQRHWFIKRIHFFSFIKTCLLKCGSLLSSPALCPESHAWH